MPSPSPGVTFPAVSVGLGAWAGADPAEHPQVLSPGAEGSASCLTDTPENLQN